MPVRSTAILTAIFLIILTASCSGGEPTGSATLPAAEEPSDLQVLSLSDEEVVDTYIYLLSRYLVIRQEHIDMAEEGVDYNVIKLNELGKAEFVNPNLDVAYLETWMKVDSDTPVVLDIPRIEGRYYTAQIMDEWADILYNINERNFPETPHGKFAFYREGTSPDIPEDTVALPIPSNKLKMLARVERKGDDEGALGLQQAFKVTPAGKPKVVPAVNTPMFTNAEPITVDVFSQPMLDQVLASAPDRMNVAQMMQEHARKIAEFVEQRDENRNAIDALIKDKALPALVQFIRTYGDKRGGWVATTGKELGFGDDYWFRAAANYAGIWWNNNQEVVYFIGEQDAGETPLNGDNVYILHFPADGLPSDFVDAYWSLTLMSLPDYRVVPNRLGRFNFNNRSEFVYEDDGSLKLYLSSWLPENAPESNWLPAPAASPFTLNLRMYVPKEEVLTGDYYVPPIEMSN